MRTEILKNLEEYYGDVLFNAQLELILAPIHEYHKQYYDTIMKYKLKEHRKGRVQGKRLITRTKQYAKQYSKAYYGGAVKEDTINVPMSSIIKKDELFATSDYSAEHMRDKTFVASENTLARVDKDINGIITDGYRDGWGINDVTNSINKRFDQLESWEAQRIARTEIHGSHMQGVMKSYEDMGVEYTQWASAHDNRTRDTHIEIDGEIIPFGGVFSNGLRYPGDTNGAISEWINCRCGNLPWFCPPGFMVPVGMTNFRESDLIPTHAFQITEDRIKQYSPDSVDKVLNQINQRSDNWDIYRLTPGERKVYMKSKKNYTILDDAIRNKNYSRLDDLEDDPMMFIRDKKTFMTNTDNLTDFSLVKEEMAEYLDDIRDYEKIIKDKNIKVDIKPKGIRWNNPDLKDYRILNENGDYVNVNREEKFIKYYFKEENLSILESVDMDVSRVRSVYQSYKELPSSMKKTKEIVLSSQKPRIVNFWGSDSYVGGYVTSTKGSTRIVQFKKPISKLKDTLVHESAHLLEKDSDWFISNSKEYILAFKKDQRRLLAQGHTLEQTYVTPYSYDFTEEFVAKRSLAVYKYGDRQFSEDFAESVKMYLRDKEAFIEKYPNKAKVIEKAIKGKYTPKNTTPYNSWFKSEQNRFKLTEKEWEHENLLKYKPELSSSEMRELEYFDDKRKLDYLYNKKINGEILEDAEEKAFHDLTKKWEKKLRLPKTSLLEEIPVKKSQLTNTEIRKELSKMSIDEKLEKIDKVLSVSEKEKYLKYISIRDELTAKLKKNPNLKGAISNKEKADKLIFQYEKKIFRHDTNIPEIDETKFILDNQEVGGSYSIEDTILEKKQIKYQENTLWTNRERDTIDAYGGTTHKRMNGYIRQDDYWEEIMSVMSEKEREFCMENTKKLNKNLDSALEKSPGLIQDTILYRADDCFDVTLAVGDYGNFSGFPSTSFQERGADQFLDEGRYKVKILAPKGTKGIAMNGKHGWNAKTSEHEFLLQTNQKYIVLDVNHDPKVRTATVLLI
ncbi:phage minor head protein [Methanobrevibacter sp.]|uniref:phage minor head protein n=1 Tax=Methanobrevibacter sp. TaxID=66852 RepID=UPI00388DEF65